jgi:Na+/H+ antiporter NhaB
MVVRYAILVGLAAASVRALFDAGATQAPMLLVDAGHTAAAPAGAPSDIAFWLLAAIATLITLSLGRFVFFGLPSMVDGWYQEHKNWIYTLIGGGLLYAVFYLM